MHIVVASDLTSRSERALKRGLILARGLKATLTVVHVVNEDLPEAFRLQSIDWARRAMESGLETVGRHDVQTDVEVVGGNPRRDIARIADSSRADLIVLGTHAAPGKSVRRFPETTAGSILTSTLKAVLVVSRGADEGYRRPLVGIDFSIFSAAAVRQAAAIAPDAELHLVHAYHVPYSGFLGNTGTEEEVAYTERLELDAFLNAEMQHLQNRMGKGRLPSVHTHLEEGAPRDVLRGACERIGADLVVIGTHSRPTISRAIWGSVALDLLSEPPCDVLVVKPFIRHGE